MPLVAAGSASINQPLKKHKIFWKAVKATFNEFAEKASVHGVQYIIDPKGNKFTKYAEISLFREKSIFYVFFL